LGVEGLPSEPGSRVSGKGIVALFEWTRFLIGDVLRDVVRDAGERNGWEGGTGCFAVFAGDVLVLTAGIAFDWVTCRGTFCEREGYRRCGIEGTCTEISACVKSLFASCGLGHERALPTPTVSPMSLTALAV